MKIYVMGGAGFGTSSSKYNGDDDDDPTKLSRFGGSAGVAFFPNSNVSIDLGLGYSSFVVKNTYDDFQGNKIDSKDTNSGVALEVGFTVFL
jgi:opacity protein-like surface antigen